MDGPCRDPRCHNRSQTHCLDPASPTTEASLQSTPKVCWTGLSRRLFSGGQFLLRLEYDPNGDIETLESN